MPDSPTPPVVDAPRRPAVSEVVASWRAELAAAGGPDPLTRYRDLPDGTLDLASAHPSGLAGFLAARPTRLSSLFREPAALADARRRARAIRLDATALADQHGVRAAHLAVGLVSWGDGEDRMTGPVLLRPITLTPRGAGQVDFDLELGAPVRANPALVRLLRRAGRPLNPRELEALATAGPGFDPQPAYRRLAEVAGDLPAFSVQPRLVVGTFVDLAPALVAELDRVAPALPGHDVVAALAGDAEAVARLASLAHSRGRRAADGTDDVRVLPLDADQRAVLQAVVAGRSLRVESPPGTGATQVLAAVVAGLAASGRRTLLVASQRAEIRGVVQRLASVGLADLVDAGEDGAETTAVPEADEPRGGRAGDPLAVLRRQHEALHADREPWGVSALTAMRELARLTSTHPAPRTAVRLADDVLRRLDRPTREQVAASLREAAELGAFDPGARRSPWHGAQLAGAEEAGVVLDAVRRLATEQVPELRREMERVAADAGLDPAGTVAGWGRQLELLLGVRATLDQFTPAVYERPVTEMVAATASASWRAEHGVELGLWQRRRWEKQARELLRPGVAPPDLHAALVAAQEQREAWQRQASGGGWPRVPGGLAAADAAYAKVVTELRHLERVLATTPGGGALLDAPLDDLLRRLDTLAADADADTEGRLPRRTAALAALRRLGLDELVTDLRERGCPPEQVTAELDLAWWRSLLQLLLGQDRDLAGTDAAAHEAALDDLRAAERRRQAAVVRQARDALAVAGAAPCRATSPLALPQEVPAETAVDVVVLAGAHRIGAAEAALALVRAAQVVVVGDPHGLPPAPVVVADEEGAGGRVGVLDLLDGALPTVRLTRQHRMPAPLAAAADAVAQTDAQVRVAAPPGAAEVVLDTVPDGSGAPGADGTVESVEAEVDRVVALVLEHARTRPDESLAVLSLSRHHARRVADALRADLPDHPDVARWLARPTSEPFVVTDADRAEDAVRDAVILTVGFGRTPHGRVLHRFGRLDDEAGERRLAVALSRARRRLTVVSCLGSSDIDADRLRSAGSRALRSLLVHVESPGPEPAGDVGDPLLVDLARRLATRGHTCTVPQVDGTALAPDLVVDGDGGAAVGVLTDLQPHGLAGAALDAALVERHLLLPDQLARFGWRVVRLGAVGLFTDPDGQVRRVLGTAR
ncbi:MAG: DUF4011 domain-containing protein [Actinomycetes bacterium]